MSIRQIRENCSSFPEIFFISQEEKLHISFSDKEKVILIFVKFLICKLYTCFTFTLINHCQCQLLYSAITGIEIEEHNVKKTVNF
jgi:hypothetical protein